MVKVYTGAISSSPKPIKRYFLGGKIRKKLLREKQGNRGPRKRTNKGRENDENRRLRGFIRASDSGKMGKKVENRCETGVNSFPRPKPRGFLYGNLKGTVGGGPGAAGWRSGRRLSDN